MKRNYIRSLLYNILFFGLTAAACVLCLPALLLPRKLAMGVVWAFVGCNAVLERWVLNLRYEVRGAEHLPKSGSYIVAAKHQSAYETMKLHILFRDPAIILKKELLSVPLWGWYLAKSDVIAIDRSSRKSAVESIRAGAVHMKEMGRPIVIFPQGTRVYPDTTTKEKPYKIGVARVQEATGLPIIPMAMNAGVYWPRNAFWKSSGTVIFEFLPPIEVGMAHGALIAQLENDIEEHSNALMEEAKTHG
ncbi:MAG: 1-acyl-sn-glycerol-3-phosphate acyltransferase [Alphaproteobacteria bacterium]|nr:1-acyl-sn-glycerol-3-phosphate acyltransferase [Alphaproteobacteria bacterium]